MAGGGFSGTGLGSSGFSGTGLGGAGFGGGGLAGGGFGGGGFGGGASTGVTASNPYRATYGNPMALGMPGGGRASFGSPLYATTTSSLNSPLGGFGAGRTGMGGAMGGTFGTGRTGLTGTRGGTFGTGRTGLTGTRGGAFGTFGSGGLMGGMNTANATTQYGRRPTAYLAVPAFAVRPAPHSRLQLELQQVLTRSSSLTSKNNIQVATEGSLVVLRGSVADERERQQAELLLSLTPGVRGIRNELEVRQAPLPVGNEP
jgi:hypothetical protein